MHVRAVFRLVHRVHHLSMNPTPWTAYAFHPCESIVQASAVVLIMFVVPMHPLALIAFQVIPTAINVYGHCGYELYPPGWSRHPVGRWDRYVGRAVRITRQRGDDPVSRI